MLEAAWRRDVLCCSEERENRPAQQTHEFHHIRTSSVREEYVGSDAAEICCTSFIGSFLGGLAIYPTSRLACEATEMGEEPMAIRNLLSTRVRFANAIDLWTDSPCCGDNFDWPCFGGFGRNRAHGLSSRRCGPGPRFLQEAGIRAGVRVQRREREDFGLVHENQRSPVYRAVPAGRVGCYGLYARLFRAG